jgi:2-hydroxychromene-2-carboxylate isomerase
MAEGIDFWLTLGSTYSYLSVTRMGAVAKTAGVNFRWRPFAGVRALTGAAMFPGGAAKTRYMWRERSGFRARLGAVARRHRPA